MTKRNTKFQEQPSAQQILKLISRAKGASTGELMAMLGWQSHSVRGLISRLGEAGIEIERTWTQGRGRVYRAIVNRFTGAKDRTRFTKAQSTKFAARGGFKAPKAAK